MPGTAKSESPDVRLGPHGLTTSHRRTQATAFLESAPQRHPLRPGVWTGRATSWLPGPEQQPRDLGKGPQRWGAARTPRGVRGAMALTRPEQAGRALCEVAPLREAGPGRRPGLAGGAGICLGELFPLRSVHSRGGAQAQHKDPGGNGGGGAGGRGECSQQPCSPRSRQKTGSVGT